MKLLFFSAVVSLFTLPPSHKAGDYGATEPLEENPSIFVGSHRKTAQHKVKESLGYTSGLSLQSLFRGKFSYG